MHSNSAFIIGSSHQVCQDYAVSQDLPDGTASAWLSDGCSSSPNTDCGARFLSYSALAAQDLALNDNIDDFYAKVIGGASELQYMLNLPPGALDATLLGIVADKENFRIMVHGDGAIALGHSDGSIEFLNINYNRGYPHYLSYAINDSARAQYEALSDNFCTIESTYISGIDGSVNTSVVTQDPQHIFYTFPVEDFNFAAVFSDGVNSFKKPSDSSTSKQLVPVSYLEVLPQLVSMKNWSGEFIHRRLQGFTRDTTKLGWTHYDDVSVAMVNFNV